MSHNAQAGHFGVKIDRTEKTVHCLLLELLHAAD